MLDTSIDRRLGHARIVFGEAVRIIPPGRHQAIVAQAANLSESGMFISSGEVFAIGTALLCDVPLSADRRLALRARVAWAKAQPSGMGIEFVDLSDGDLSLLRRAIAQGHPLDWSRPVKIWFEGMPQPSRAEARPTPSGVVVLSELRFLRLRSRVVLCFANDESRSGTLHDVTLRTRASTVPELQLAVQFDPPSAEPAATWTYWPPPPVTNAAPTEEVVLDAELPEAAESDAQSPSCEALAAEPPEAVHAAEVIIEPADDEVELVVDLTRIATGGAAASSCAAGSITAVALPSPPVSAEPKVRADDDLLRLPADAPYAIEASSDPSHWELKLPLAESSHWKLRTEGGLAPKRRRRHAWLWAIALLMSSVTVASMAYTNLWGRVRDRLLPRPLPPPLVVVAPSPPMPASTIAGDEPHLAASPPAAGAERAPSAPPKRSAETNAPAGSDNPPPREPELVSRRGRWTLVIPIRGSTAGATHYPLASPAGLAVNLPRAQPLLRFGEYSLTKGFRRIWVRRRGEGLHLRVFFLGDGVPSHALRFTRGSVRVELQPAP
jgi:hypothetical protein